MNNNIYLGSVIEVSAWALPKYAQRLCKKRARKLRISEEEARRMYIAMKLKGQCG